MKTDLTLEIENKLKAKAQRESKRYAFEVPVPNGICDFITTKISYENHNIPYVTCYEIKVSLSDYWNSENGANFLGDENYYVMPDELIEEIISKNKQGKFQGVGLISYENGKFYKKTDGKAFRCKLTLEDKLKLMDFMMMRMLYQYKGDDNNENNNRM